MMKRIGRNIIANTGFGLALAIFIVIGTLYYMNVTAMTEFHQIEEQSYDEILELDGLIAAMKDVEIGELAFILTREDKVLGTYYPALNQVERHLAKLKSLTNSHMAQQNPAYSIEPLIREKLTEVKHTIHVRGKYGFQAAYQLEFTDQHERLADEIRSQLAEARDAIKQQLSRQDALNDASIKKTILVFLAGNIVSFAFLISTFILLKREISKSRRTEGEIRLLNATLAERAAELEIANQELDVFNYTAAHDLRQPLNTINGYCQAIKELCGDKLDKQCKDYIQEAYNGTLRMNRLIEALLKFSSMGRDELHLETVDLCAIAKEVSMELKQVHPERSVTLRITDGLFANGDEKLLRLVLDNLIGNAWKYTGTREEGIIEFGTTEIDGTPAFFVKDNGSGFNMADAGKLFTPFQRLPGAEEYRGFGIGLATVERIIRRHGGRVWAEGVPDKGATFYFTLQALERNKCH